MGFTTRWRLPYPVANASNDVPLDMQALADKVDQYMAGASQGPISQRPRAGIAGRFYNATDWTLAFDDGTKWTDITWSPWRTWTPGVWKADNGGGQMLDQYTVHIENVVISQYRVRNTEVEIDLRGTIRVTDGTGTFKYAQMGVFSTLPLNVAPGSSYWVMTGDAWNSTTRVHAVPEAYPDGRTNVISVYPNVTEGGFYRVPVNSGATSFRVRGDYRTG